MLVTVKAIEKRKGRAKYAHAGEMCEIQITTNDKRDFNFIKAGHVMCDPKYPIYQIYKFRATIFVYDTDPITKG